VDRDAALNDETSSFPQLDKVRRLTSLGAVGVTTATVFVAEVFHRSFETRTASCVIHRTPDSSVRWWTRVITSTRVEIFHRGTRVASHAFSAVRNRHTTITEHLPSAHRRYAEWTPARLIREAEKIGSATLALFEAIMRTKPHPEQGFRSCLGILRLAKEWATATSGKRCPSPGGRAASRTQPMFWLSDQIAPLLRADVRGKERADDPRVISGILQGEEWLPLCAV